MRRPKAISPSSKLFGGAPCCGMRGLTPNNKIMSSKNDFISRKMAGSKGMNEPRRLSEVLNEYFAGNEPLAAAYRHRKLFENIFPHTELCCELKLLTRQPGRLNEGTMLDGIIARDGDDRYVFIEKAHEKKVTTVRRTPVIYSGDCVNVHRMTDGTYRLAFCRPHFYAGFSFADFCLAAAHELLAIARLLGDEDSEE